MTNLPARPLRSGLLALAATMALTVTACPHSDSGSTGTGGTGGVIPDGGARADTGAVAGSDGGGGTGGTAPTDCEGSARRWCEHLFGCDPGYVTSSYGSVERCAQEDAADCHRLAGLSGASPTFIQWWAACNGALASQSCDDDNYGGSVAACQSVPGAGKTGEACLWWSQCASNYCLHPKDSNDVTAECGACAVPVKLGAACDPYEDVCEPGLVCDFDAKICVHLVAEGAACGDPKTTQASCQGLLRCLDGKCTRPRPTGGACMDDLDCRTGLLCISGACAPPLALGAACQLMELKCASGLTCVAGKCAPPLHENAACTWDWECLGSFCDGTRDAVTHLVADGHCSNDDYSVGLGEACTPNGTTNDAGANSWCREGFCDPATSKCVPPRLVGEDCPTDDACYFGLVCTAGKCGYPAPDKCK